MSDFRKSTRRYRSLSALSPIGLAAGLAFAAPQAAHAVTWTGAFDASMNNAGNWDAPVNVNGVLIDIGAAGASNALTVNAPFQGAGSGIGNMTIARPAGLSITNVGAANIVGLRFAGNAGVTINAGTGAVDFGGADNAYIINMGTGTSNWINNSATAADINSNVQLNATGGTDPVVAFGGTGAWNFTGTTSTTVKGLVKNGGANLTLGGNNAHSGETIVNAGTLTITNSNALGATGAANDTHINGSNGATGTTLIFSGAALTIAETLNFNANATGRSGFTNNNAFAQVLNGPIDVTSDTNLVQWNSSGSGSVTINGDITGTMTNGSLLFLRGGSTNANNRVLGSINIGSATLAKTDDGLWVVGNAGETYAWGNTNVARGTLRLNLANVLPSATIVNVGQGTDGSAATLDLFGFSQTVAGLTKAGNGTNKQITNSSATAATLTVNNAVDNTYGGRINGNLALTKTGAGILTLTDVNAYTGGTFINAGTLQVTASDALPNGGEVTFSGTSTLDIGSTTQTLSAMNFNAAATTNTTINGAGGTLIVNGGNLQIGPGGAMTAARSTTLNMSGLDNFTFDSAAGTFRVGLASGTTNTVALGQVATATLADNSTITANLLAVADVAANNDGGAATLRLGSASNIINANTINIGASGRSDALLDFSAAGATATFRGAAGGASAVGNWNIGSISQFTGAAQTAFTADVNLGNGTIDAIVTNMTIGNANTGGATNRAGTTDASFTMGAGSMTVGTLTVGQIAGGGSIGAAYTSIADFTMNNAAGTLNATNINLANNTITATGAFAKSVTGNFNLVNGTVIATNIQRGVQTGTATAVDANFNWTNGTVQNTTGSDLNFNNVDINLLAGTHTFSATSGNTIHVNANSLISGVGGLNKTGAGTLILHGANTFAGNVVVNNGVLNLRDDAALGAVAKTVTIAGNASASPSPLIPELQLQGDIDIAMTTLLTSGNGVAGGGVLRNISGNNSITANNIFLAAGNGGSEYQSDSGLLTLNANVSANTSSRVLTLDGAGDGRINGIISNGTYASPTALPLIKNGTGTWTLNGAHTYTGATTINNGTLTILGSTAGGALTINNGGTLAGEATIGGNTLAQAGSFISPGELPGDIGTLNFANNLTINGSLLIDVDGTGPGDIDLINVGGILNIANATLDFNLFNPIDDGFYIFATYGSLVGEFSNVVSAPGGYVISYNFRGNQIALVQIPEPATMSLLALGSLGLLRRRREVR